MSEEIKVSYKFLDIDYQKEEYAASKYLWDYEKEAGMHGVDEIKFIEEKYGKSGDILFDEDFSIFWDFYKKNLVDFDTKANIFKEKYQKMQKYTIFFTLTLPQIISFFALIDWGAYNLSYLIPLLIPIPLSFLTAFFLSIIGLKKYEQLFMNYRISCEKLKRSAFDFQFSTQRGENRKIEFIRDVLNLVNQQISEFEGIFIK
ncbi:MAG TPA: hypothetical protein VMV49_02885 [Candidatus Deferrimicrobium sp.]|nr:hypothetical protein [Candidatus Deferrimicrobium sp.]